METTFPGMVERCREVGFDLARVPVKVSPTAHFHMGGARIDQTCRTNLEGLFVAGEDSGGVHGANRLGGNGVAESLVFGTLAGDAMAGFLPQRGQPSLNAEEIERAIQWAIQPFDHQAGENIFGIRREIEDLMWAEGGLVRSGPGLQKTLDGLKEIGERARLAPVSQSRQYHPGWQEWLDVQSILTVARLTCESALARRESRGSHYRSDFPEPDDADWLCNVLVQNGPGGEPKLWFEKVRFSRLEPPETTGQA